MKLTRCLIVPLLFALAGPVPAEPDTTPPAVENLREGWEQDSAARRGWQTGTGIGAAAGGVFGLLASLFLDSLGESNTGDTLAPNIGLTVGFAAAGAVAVGAIGALIGSGFETWYPPHSPTATARWRLEPHVGLAVTDDLDSVLYEDLHLRIFVPRRLGRWFEAGPDLGWMRLGTYLESWEGRTATTDDTWQAGATARAFVPGGALEPFFTFGLGWYYRGDSYLGTNYGLGLRLGPASLEVRSHDLSADIDQVLSNSLTTVSFGMAFGL